MILLHLGFHQFTRSLVVFIDLSPICIFHGCFAVSELFEATWYDALFVTLAASKCSLFCGILTQCYGFSSFSILWLNITLATLTVSSHVIIVGTHRWDINRMVHTNRWKFGSSLLSSYSFVDILEVFTRMHFGTVSNGLILLWMLLPLNVLTQLCSRQKLRVVKITWWINVKH